MTGITAHEAPEATTEELRELTKLTIAAMNSGILNKNIPLVISPPLAAKLVELQEEGGLDIKVVAARPDSALVLVTNGDPEPFLMTVSLPRSDRLRRFVTTNSMI